MSIFSIYNITTISTMLSVLIFSRLAISFLLIASSDSTISVCCILYPNLTSVLYVTLYRAISYPPENFQFHKNNYYSNLKLSLYCCQNLSNNMDYEVITLQCCEIWLSDKLLLLPIIQANKFLDKLIRLPVCVLRLLLILLCCIITR